MSHTRAHKIKWTVFYIATGYSVRFATEESARIRCLECEGVTPVRLIAPIYGED